MATIEDLANEVERLRRRLSQLEGDDPDTQQAMIEALTDNSDEANTSPRRSDRTGESAFSRIIAELVRRESIRRHNRLSRNKLV